MIKLNWKFNFRREERVKLMLEAHFLGLEIIQDFRAKVKYTGKGYTTVKENGKWLLESVPAWKSVSPIVNGK